MMALAPFPNVVSHPGSLELGDGRSLTLGEVLGQGSFATVHRGVLSSRSGVRRSVAVKLFGPVASEDDAFVTLLTRTARRVACLDHPNIAQVYDCGVWQSQPYLVQELVDGVTLRTLTEVYASKNLRLPLDLALFVACEIAEALAASRDARDPEGAQLDLLHQGLACREVLLSWRGDVKVSDFEMACVYDGASSGVQSIEGLASRAAMMAPEVAQGNLPDPRSDVFSFGVLLRELLIGPRFSSSLANGEAIRLASEGYLEPLTFRPHLPAGLVDILRRALEVDPRARFPHVGAMAYHLRREALKLEVGDGRYFLRRALEQHWAVGEAITAEIPAETMSELCATTLPPAPGAEDGGYAELVDLYRRA